HRARQGGRRAAGCEGQRHPVRQGRGGGNEWQLWSAHRRTVRHQSGCADAMKLRRGLLLLCLLLTSLLPLMAQAAGGEITLFNLNDTENGQEFSVKLQILIIMTLLGFLPAMLMMMTCFTRFIIVLAILRQAIGLQQSPPNQVLIGIALI